eukprot:6486118-Amphidinium_carterae.1
MANHHSSQSQGLSKVLGCFPVESSERVEQVQKRLLVFIWRLGEDCSVNVVMSDRTDNCRMNWFGG